MSPRRRLQYDIDLLASVHDAQTVELSTNFKISRGGYSDLEGEKT